MDNRQYIAWVKGIQTLAVICHKWAGAASEQSRDIWRRAALLQLQYINWRAVEMEQVRDLPKEYPTCKTNVMTKEQLFDTLRQMFS